MFRLITPEEAAPRVAVAAGGDLDFILNELRAGQAAAFDVDGGAACLVARVEGDELVIVCFEGRNHRRYLPAIFEQAKKTGSKTVRFHCSDKRVQRMARALPGVYEAERVYRVVL